MKQPDKWKETIDPFSIIFKKFKLITVLGYPHARNDVFYCLGEFAGEKMHCFLKYASKTDSNLLMESKIIEKLNFSFLPQIIEYDESGKFMITKEVEGMRLSDILRENKNEKSFEYMYEYGQSLAKIHQVKGDFFKVKHRKFFDTPNIDYLKSNDIDFIHNFLIENKPININECFCHGDFHYANILWTNKKIVAVLDWELSGIGNKEFDIAWAIINRPGQKFLRTKREINEFLKGYLSVNTCNKDYVKYYMILIYSHFISVDKKNIEYQAFVRKTLNKMINRKN